MNLSHKVVSALLVAQCLLSACSQKSYSEGGGVKNTQSQNKGDRPILTSNPVPTNEPTPERTNTPVQNEVICTQTLKDLSDDYNLQSMGDLRFENSESQLSVLAGQNGEFRKSKVGTTLSPDGARADLSVGGIFKGKNVDVPNGQIRSNGIPDFKNTNALGGVQRGLTFDVRKLIQRNQEVLQSCFQLKPTAIGYIRCETRSEGRACRVQFDGTHPKLNIFDVTLSRVTQGAPEVDLSEIRINSTPLSKVVIRMIGKNLKWSTLRTVLPSNVNPSDITWVFRDADSIQFSKMSFMGNVIAPNASIETEGIQWSGFATSRSMQISNSLFLKSF